jgi:hypothetical protein
VIHRDPPELSGGYPASPRGERFGIYSPCAADGKTERKAFFSEEKKQKTFIFPPIPSWRAMERHLQQAQT